MIISQPNSLIIDFYAIYAIITQFMSESMNFHNEYSLSQDFRAELYKIISTPLTAENYTDYANSALNELIDLTIKICNSYSQKTGTLASGRKLEDAAFKHFALPDIDQAILPHIISESELIRRIGDQVCAALENPVPKVILPPDKRVTTIVPSDGSFDKDRTPIPRTEMLMFILANEFNVDLANAEQFRISTGILPEDTMREASYNLVETNFLDESQVLQSRLIFVNNTPENATFIINGEIAQKLIGDNFSDDLAGLCKTDLRDLLRENPNLGQVIFYRDSWLKNLVEVLNSPRYKKIETKKETTHSSKNYLIPELGEGETTISKLAGEAGIAYETLNDFVDNTNFPSLGIRRNGARTVNAYDRDTLINELSQAGLIGKKVRNDEISANAFSKKCGLSRPALQVLFEELGIKPIGTKQVGSVYTAVYKESELWPKFNMSKYAVEPIGSDEAAVRYIHDETGVDGKTIKKIINVYNIESKKRRSPKGKIVDVYPKKTIIDLLITNGHITPKYSRSLNKFGKLIGKDGARIGFMLKKHDIIDPNEIYNKASTGKNRVILNTNQQLKILEYLHAHIYAGRPYIDDETYGSILAQLMHERDELESMNKNTPEESSASDENPHCQND